MKSDARGASPTWSWGSQKTRRPRVTTDRTMLPMMRSFSKKMKSKSDHSGPFEKKKTRCYFCIRKEWRLVCSAQISGLFGGADNLIFGRRDASRSLDVAWCRGLCPWKMSLYKWTGHQAAVRLMLQVLLGRGRVREKPPAWAALVCLGKDTQKNLKSYPWQKQVY